MFSFMFICGWTFWTPAAPARVVYGGFFIQRTELYSFFDAYRKK